MKNIRRNRIHARRLLSGQTLIMALFVLGILLILGFVFLGVVNQNIVRAGVGQQRSASQDLAEAGIRFAHNQLLYSAQGADYRLTPTGPLTARDPDADYLQLDPDANPANGDQGGPDGLGAYTRVNFSNGRALVRVRYAPSDTILFAPNPTGNLRQPGKARSYLIIESVGKVGRVNPNDPTTVLGADRRESKKQIGFVSVGMLEHGRFFHNKDRENRPVEIGFPTQSGARYPDSGGNQVDVNVPVFWGSALPMYDFGNPPTPSAGAVPTGGSIYSNADLQIFGTVVANLNYTLGEAILVHGRTYGADNNSTLQIRRANWDPSGGNWVTNVLNLANNTSPSLDSRNSNFSTFDGVIRDGDESADAGGWVRGVRRKEPPSITTPDPETGRTRFEELTRNSGKLGPSGNDGRFGHGQGVYVNNSQDRQIRADEQGREDVGTAESLVYDWFNPNNGQANSGWKGPFYTPVGASIQLLSDGFLIQRDSRAQGNERTWRNPDGSNTGSTQIRYRIGDPDGAGPIRTPFIINTFTPGVNINAANPNYSLGQPFNGVVMFDGNVKIRGTIATDIQLTIVSNATIYIEGSITKGLVGNNWTQFDPNPSDQAAPFARISRPSRSMLMLMAKEYVAVNTTMFFGPPPSQTLEEVNESPGAIAWNPVRIREAGGTLGIRAEVLLDPETPGSNPLNPTTWSPYVWGPGAGNSYRENDTGNFIEPKLLLSSTMDDGPAPFTFMSMDVNFGIGTPANPSTFLFPMDPVWPYNSASGQGPFVPGYTTPGYATPNWIPMYGWGAESWQRYPKFESAGFPLVSDVGTGFAFPLVSMNAPQGRFQLIAQETNDFAFRHNNVGGGSTNDWLLARAAIVPHDLRIEAAVFAEEGSFVVIPGNWFNPNPNDRRDVYMARVNAVGLALADQERRENFGAHPDMPFYGEPIDVRITVVGSITENMPLPISQQAEWLRKWGWIPRSLGATGRLIPSRHVPQGYSAALTELYVPNLYVIYDSALSTGRTSGYDVPVGSDTSKYIRRDAYGRPLAPMPRLPVSPTLSYFGEVLP
jgi:hypothetical protein